MSFITALHPYPSSPNAGTNARQLTAATLVGLMSVPGLAVLHGVKRNGPSSATMDDARGLRRGETL